MESYVRGYVMNPDGSHNGYCLLRNIPQNIAAFIAGNQTPTIVTDVMDEFIISGNFGFVDRCPDQEYLLKKIHPAIIPMQLTGVIPELEIKPEFDENQAEDHCF